MTVRTAERDGGGGSGGDRTGPRAAGDLRPCAPPDPTQCVASAVLRWRPLRRTDELTVPSHLDKETSPVHLRAVLQGRQKSRSFAPYPKPSWGKHCRGRSPGGGECSQGASNPIATKKLRKYCGAVTKPPDASRRNTFAHATRRAPRSTRGGQAKSSCGKIAGNCKNCGPNPPPLEAARHHAQQNASFWGVSLAKTGHMNLHPLSVPNEHKMGH